MGLVERVASERLNQIEYFARHILLKAFILGSGDEVHPFFGHQRSDLLSHGLPNDVGCPQRVTGELLQYQQHLVLVNDDAVGLVQQFFETGMRIGDRFAAVFSIDEHIDVFHGPRAIEGDHCRDVAQVGGLQGLDIALHPRAFKLEQVVGIA